jgi:hypothetical protein
MAVGFLALVAAKEISMLLIGSSALAFTADISREPKDADLIATIDEYEDFVAKHRESLVSTYPINKGKKCLVFLRDAKPIEMEIAWPNSTAETLLNILSTQNLPTTSFFGQDVYVAPLDVLYQLKLSHKFLKNSPHFLKTMRDIQFMETLGAKVTMPDWLKARELETYDYKHPKLNVSKDDFFKKDEGVTYVYDHDSIHEAVKRYDRPAYTYFKPENSQVLCDRAMFEASSREIQLASVVEEATVLALERSQIPFKDQVTPKWSFDMALMKVCTSITSGWWRSFAYSEYDNVQALYDENYVSKFWKAVEKGVVVKL